MRLGCAVLLAFSVFGQIPLLRAGTAVDAYPAFYPADAARGAPLATTCSACHHAEPMVVGAQAIHVPKLTGQRPNSIFDALLEYKSGARPSDLMAPIAAALSEQDMRDVAQYLAGPDIKPARDPLPDTWARRRVHEDCEACHGETGIGVMPGIPVIGGQYADYLVYALQSYRSDVRSNPTMRAMARNLSDEQMHELAQYFADRGYLRAGP